MTGVIKNNKKPIYSASLMCMDLLNMKEQFAVLNERIDMYHVDIMDGHFAKNITLSPDFVRTCSRVATRPMDCHLMVEHPEDYVEQLASAGASYISCHAETIYREAFRIMDQIKDLGCKIGIALNPATPLEYARHYLNRVDLLTIMTVDIGYSGSNFIPEMMDKVREAVRYRTEHGLGYIIQVDGACNKENFKVMHESGVEAYVMGNTGLFGLADDLSKALDVMEGNMRVSMG